MGLASSQAQELVLPITTFEKLLNSSHQKLYIFRDAGEPFSVIGILKIGRQRLFICNEENAQHELDAMCVSDFYIHESRQRCGYGHEMFQIMLENENMEPSKFAFDQPSFKFLSFFDKHFKLKDPKPQPNNIVVYEGFLNRDGSQYFGDKFSKTKNLESSYSEKSHKSLQTIPVSPSQCNCSCVGKCHHGNDTSHDSEKNRKQLEAGTFPVKKTSSPYSGEHQNEQNWGVFDAMHSYPKKTNALETCPHGCHVLDSIEHEKNCGVYDAMHR